MDPGSWNCGWAPVAMERVPRYRGGPGVGGPILKNHQKALLMISQKQQKHGVQMDVSKNRGSPKWIVYNGTPH